MNSTQEDTSDLTGLPARIPKLAKLNEVRLNGKDGNFIYVDQINRKKDEKAEKTDLGQSVDFIFLRQRRRIAGYNKPLKKMYISTEHNDKNDNVYMFGAKDKGTAEEMYNKYNVSPVKMHTERVVYAFLLRPQHERELVRLIVKGSTLNFERDGKADTTVDYFAFIQDEKRVGHLYEYVTRMTPVKESNDLGEYYSIHFATVSRLTSEQIEVVVKTLKQLRDDVADQDAFYRKSKKPEEANVPTIDAEDDEEGTDPMVPAHDKDTYPKDEISLDDIQF